MKMEKEEKVKKMNRETCFKELKEASTLKGDESKSEIHNIFEKCQCIQIAILHKGLRGEN